MQRRKGTAVHRSNFRNKEERKWRNAWVKTDPGMNEGGRRGGGEGGGGGGIAIKAAVIVASLFE